MIISFQSGDLDLAKGFRISNSKGFSSEDLNYVRFHILLEETKQ